MSKGAVGAAATLARILYAAGREADARALAPRIEKDPRKLGRHCDDERAAAPIAAVAQPVVTSPPDGRLPAVVRLLSWSQKGCDVHPDDPDQQGCQYQIPAGIHANAIQQQPQRQDKQN